MSIPRFAIERPVTMFMISGVVIMLGLMSLARLPIDLMPDVTFPSLRPVFTILLIYHALVALTTYDLVYAMTAGVPGTATTLLSFRIWQESFSMMNFGTGSAIAFILVLLSLAFIAAIVKALPPDLLPRRA